MAKNASMFVKMAVVVSLALMLVVFTESRSTLIGGQESGNSIVSCNQVTGVEPAGDCTSISQSFKLSLEAFLAINPNINCLSLFKVVMSKQELDGNVGKKEVLKWIEKMDIAFIEAMITREGKGNMISGTFTTLANVDTGNDLNEKL
ncbi:hypothetical protein L2E82_15168 [Cichorium intybus]|uniref:Uncharacterized protein n=1 Tax=Cichorium intybus TaxID=13427 RepID=A0ACB9F231_CICIN|nr:hypothetical protein L2E82_15168 [Cichorium intybus]